MDTKVFVVLLTLGLFVGVNCDSKGGKLQIGVKKRVEDCDMRTRKGDKLEMHYTVSHAHPVK